MSHIHDDELALISLGEPVLPQDAEHLSECGECQRALEQLKAVVETSRSITQDDQLLTPPSTIWSAVVAELGLPTEVADEETYASGVRPISSAKIKRRVPVWLAVAAAGVGILAGSVITAGIVGLQNSNGSPVTVVATANLAPVANSGSQGTAVLETTDQGGILRVSVRDLPPVTDGYYEVWVASADAKTMVAMGALNPDADSSFSLPPGMQMKAFPLVDVSVEHFDGNTGHSAQSVVRGQLVV